MPTARYLGCVASVGKNLLYAGMYSYYPNPTNAYRMEMLVGMLSITNAPTVSPTVGPCAVTAPTNGALGTCTSSLGEGTTCQFTCSAGYTATGATSCSAVGVLTAATCAEPWTTKKAMPLSGMEDVGQSCAGVTSATGSFYYQYRGNSPFGPYPATADMMKYTTATDAWSLGNRPSSTSRA